MCVMLLAGPASGWMAAQHRPNRAPVLRAATPLLRQVDVADLPARPPMTPGQVVQYHDDEEEEDDDLELKDLTPEEITAKQKALMDAAVIGDANSKIVMDRLKNDEDNDGGISAALGKFLLVLDPTGTVRRRLWTRADFMHIHAVTGAYFLFLGIPWLIYSHVVGWVETRTPRARRTVPPRHAPQDMRAERAAGWLT
mgnify:CR=1 FL=1